MQPMPGAGSGDGLNAEVWLEHRKNVELVFAHDLFKDIKDTDPIGINKLKDDGDSGVQAVFEINGALSALTKRGSYKAGINLAWVNPYFSTSNNIPIMWTSVADTTWLRKIEPASFRRFSLQHSIRLWQVMEK